MDYFECGDKVSFDLGMQRRTGKITQINYSTDPDQHQTSIKAWLKVGDVEFEIKRKIDRDRVRICN